jgi:hypothetical protein
LFLWRVAIETVPPRFVIPPAGADVCFARHALNISNAMFGARVWRNDR